MCGHELQIFNTIQKAGSGSVCVIFSHVRSALPQNELSLHIRWCGRDEIKRQFVTFALGNCGIEAAVLTGIRKTALGKALVEGRVLLGSVGFAADQFRPTGFIKLKTRRIAFGRRFIVSRWKRCVQ